MLTKHESLGLSVEINQDFTQEQYEKYQELIIEKGDGFKSIAAKTRIIIEAAQDAKIVTKIEGVYEKPVAVKWLTMQIIAAIDKALEIPQE